MLDYAQGLSRRAGVCALYAGTGCFREARSMACAHVIRRIAEKWIKPDVVIWRVKAGMVEKIECLHIEAQFEAFGNAEVFEDGHVHT